MVAGLQVRHVGSRAAVGEPPAFSICFSSRGPFPVPFFFFFSSSFSPERTEFILSGQQPLSVRGLQGDFSKARKQYLPRSSSVES